MTALPQWPAMPVRLTPLRQAYEDAQANVRELLAASMRRSTDGGFSVSLERDSKGVTKPSVVVRQCEQFPSLEDAEAAAVALYERLRSRYPLASGYVGAEGEGE